MPDLKEHPDQQRAERQARAAAFWQKTIDEGRALREAEEKITRPPSQRQRQDRAEHQEPEEKLRRRLTP